MITLQEKYKAAQRELALRKSVYPKWVEVKRMKAHAAEHEIACMEAIVADYELLMNPVEDRTGWLRPIVGMSARTPQEVFDIMCDRIRQLSKVRP